MAGRGVELPPDMQGMDLTLKDIIKATGGALKGPLAERVSSRRVKGISTDSRTIEEGEVFFALNGPNFSGRDYIGQAFSKGAIASVSDGDCHFNGYGPVIAVQDALKALGDLALFVRSRFPIPVIAVTGSSGKTTTKDMIGEILGIGQKVLKTKGNLNNLIGLPLTLFGLRPEHRAVVLELGISEKWEMPRLAGICRPDIALITNIGHAHLKTLGTIDDVREAKASLFSGLGPNGVRVVNLDDQRLRPLASESKTSVTFSLKEDADVRVTGYEPLPEFGGMNVRYDIRGSKLEAMLKSPSISSVANSAAAIAAVLPLNAGLYEIKEGLSRFVPSPGRMQAMDLGGIVVLDDTYNANPESMGSALKTLSLAKGRRIAVLGDMLELGHASEAEHRGIGRTAALLGIDMVAAIGGYAGDIAKGALSEGVGGLPVLCFRDKAEAIDALQRILKRGDTVLVKGSRLVGLEDVIEWLKCNACAL